jgi:hypothetical protein
LMKGLHEERSQWPKESSDSNVMLADFPCKIYAGQICKVTIQTGAIIQIT